jgi:SPP1 family predicted phage head-tail adaptor
MRPGTLDRRVVVEKPTKSRATNGAEVVTWVEIATVFANVRYISATERFQSDSNRSVKVANFRMRYLSIISETMRLKFDNKVWKITGLAEIGRREGLDVTAEVIL